MGHENGIGRIGRREGPPIEPRLDPGGMGVPEGPQLPGNTGIAGPQAPPANTPPVEVPKDGFVTDPGNMPATTMLNGETTPTFQPVSNLVPNLNHINELGEIPMRFAADSALLRSQLLSPGLPQTEQVERNFQFFVAYAERFVEIARPLEAKAELTHQDDPNGKMPRQPPGEKGEKAPPSVPPGPEDGGVFTHGPDGRFPVPHPEGHVPIPVDGHPIPEGDVPLPEGQLPEGPGDGRVIPDGKLPAPPLPRMDEPSYPGTGAMFQVIEQQEPTAPPMKFYTPEQVQENVREFTRALQDSGFTQIRDARTGKDGVELARDLLNARTPQEVEQKAKEITVRYEAPPPPPDEAQTPRERNQQAITRELPLEPVRDLASDAARGVDPRRGVDLGASRGAQPMIDGGFGLPPSQMPTRELEATPEGRHDRHGYSTKRLGARMLWNVLHTFRRTGSDTATEDAKWDRITFGAMLFLGGVMVGVIILVSIYV